MNQVVLEGGGGRETIDGVGENGHIDVLCGHVTCQIFGLLINLSCQ